MRLRILLVGWILSMSVQAMAQKVGITAGFSLVEVEADSGIDISSNLSYQFGGLFYMPMSEVMVGRVGALLLQESFLAKSGSNETTIQLTHLSVPLTVGWTVTERLILFAGPVLNLNAAKSCSHSTASMGSCNVSDLKVKSSDILISMGGNFQLTDELGLELSYDRMSVKPFANTSGGHLIHVNFQYVIE